MKTRIALIAIATLSAGSAFAQTPAAGEGPLFLNEAKFSSNIARQDVREQARAQLPAAGKQSGPNLARSASGNEQASRAEVREATRANIAQGRLPAAGERS